MSNKNYTQKITSKYILKEIFSHLQLNIFYKIIKYNKKIQNRLNINFKDSIFNYEYTIKAKNDIIENIKDIKHNKKYKYLSV